VLAWRGRRDTRPWPITVWQARSALAIREPHAGERLAGLTDPILAPEALAPQVEWASCLSFGHDA
jgi:hypothetical protein